MVPSRYLCLALFLLCGHFATAQTVVQSIFLNRFPDANAANYNDPSNWSPAEVPNNTVLKHYNVLINTGFAVEVNVDSSISHLTLSGPFTGLNIRGKTLVVAGTSTNLGTERGAIYVESSATAAAKLDAGMLTTFSNKTLTGYYIISSYGSPATLQFRGADISKLSDAHLGLYGPLAQIVDESGNDALRNLARVQGGTLGITDHSLVTNAPFRNEGDLTVTQYQAAAAFTAAVSLTNFDPATRTIYLGSFSVTANDPAAGAAELRFNGADIVNIGSWISLYGSTARIVDLAGNDGLRNLARILGTAGFRLGNRTLATAGPFQNDGYMALFDHAVFVVGGAFANFDPATRTFGGGGFDISDNSQLKFAGADIVHNAAFITLSTGGAIRDLAGNDGLRNFSDNLTDANFTLGPGSQFTAPGDFTNSGTIETYREVFTIHESEPGGRFIVPPGFAYTQKSGGTGNGGFFSAEHINILGGEFSAFDGTVHGNVMVGNATIALTAPAVLEGELTLGPDSHFHYYYNLETPREITGKVTLAGTLEVDIPNTSFVSSTAFLTILKSASPFTGVFSNAPNGTRIPTVDGQGSVVVYYDSKSVSVGQYQAEPPPAQLLNISSRALLSKTTDDAFGDRAVIIGGFIVSGSVQKEIVVRGLGPSLKKFGLDPVLPDPVLELHASDGSVIASNDNWTENRAEIAATGLAPEDEREAALRTMVVPGTYTVVVKEKAGLAGHGLVEIYDLSQSTTSKLVNISTRGFADSNTVLVGGVIVGGSGQGNDEVVVRALGPQLRRYGVLNALDDPTLEVRNANGGLLGYNDNWNSNTSDTAWISSTGLAPFNNSESAILLSLPRGSYTAIVRAKPNGGGVALVEFYDLRR
jgi:hypothetical protein